MTKQPTTARKSQGAAPRTASGDQTQHSDDGVTQTDQDVADIHKEQGLGVNDAPEPDEDDPDALEEATSGGEDEDVGEEENEDVLVRLVHETGHQHINGHPLEDGTVVLLKRADFEKHREQGVRLSELDPDKYDGEIYDVSEPWKAEQKDKHGNVISSEEIASEEA